MIYGVRAYSGTDRVRVSVTLENSSTRCGVLAGPLKLPRISVVAPPGHGTAVAGIILATPVYMGSMSSQAKAFLDRTVLFRRNGFMFKNRLGGVIAVGGSRNGGQELTIQGVHAAMMIHGMILVGDGEHFGSAAWSNHPDGYQEDTTGIASATDLGRHMAAIARMMKLGSKYN